MAHLRSNTGDDRPARLLKMLPTSSNASDALLKAGYSRKTALKQPKRTINSAIETVSKRALQGDSKAARILEQVGISRAQLMERYRSIIFSENEAVSLKAIQPLITLETGIRWDNPDEQKPPAVINLIVSNTAQPSRIYDIEPPTQEAR